MSGIACIFNLDGTPVVRAKLASMEEVLKSRGPDGSQSWRQSSVGMARTHFWTVPEEVGEVQPLPVAGGRYWIVSDARLDNRDELIPVLQAHLGTTRPTDAELIVAAYRKWGDDCARELIGDFAFVIWDSMRRRLFCARDPIGVRVLHYCRTGNTLIVGSTVGSILAALETPPAPNDAFLRDLVAGRYDRWLNETSYESIVRLPPAFALSATASGHVATRYYTLGEAAGPQFTTDREYVDHFRTLFEQAVRTRMRSTNPVGMLVSGGLDSSSIACVAEQLVSAAKCSETARLYSCTFDSTPRAEEREYFDAVADTCAHLEKTTVSSDDCWGLREFGTDNGFPLDEPEISVDRSLMLKPMRQARRDGCRVMMSGYWADQVLSGDAYHMPDMLRDISVTRVPRELPHFVRATGRSSWWLLPYAHLRSWLPAPVRSLLRGGQPSDLLAEDTGRAAAPGTAAMLLAAPAQHGHASELIYQQLTDGLNSARLQMHDTLAAYVGVEWRFPFLDRRLVDFMLTLPAAMRFRGGWTKYVLRQAMTGILPEKVRQRATFARFDELTERGLRERERHRVEALLPAPLTVRRGLVDAERVSSAWAAYWKDDRPQPHRHLVGTLCVEAWLRHREESEISESKKRDKLELAYQS